jgi:hypothetical protein
LSSGRAVSSVTRLMFFMLQLLLCLRGVNRIVDRSSSTPLRTPSIHPKQSASSTTCDQVSDRRPEPFL